MLFAIWIVLSSPLVLALIVFLVIAGIIIDRHELKRYTQTPNKEN